MDMATPLPAPPLPVGARALDSALHEAMAASADRSFALAYRILGNHADAHDALQDAWLRAWSKRRDQREDAPVGAWLRVIVVRECLRALKWRGVRRWLPFGERVPDLADAPPHTDEQLDAARVRALVAAFPAQQRVAFTLRFDEGWTLPEIAEALGVAPETVKTHLARALQRVRAELGGPHAL